MSSILLIQSDSDARVQLVNAINPQRKTVAMFISFLSSSVRICARRELALELFSAFSAILSFALCVR